MESHDETAESKLLSRKERLKLKKKARRKEKRHEVACERDKELEHNPEIQAQKEVEEQLLEIQAEQERIKREQDHQEWLAREEQFKQDLIRKQLESEEKQRKEKERQELMKLEREKREKEWHEKEQLRQQQMQIQQQQLSKPDNPNFGTEKDTFNCAFYLKTGSCRFGDRCGKNHPRPVTSSTLLFKNMYEGPGFKEVLDEDYDDSLQYDENELRKHFEEFYYDVLPEFEIFGELIQFKVCRNHASHLRGNVYVQFKEEKAAIEAFQNLSGRFYASKQLNPEFAPVTKWKTGICGDFDRGHCSRGKDCNFLHVFKNPNGEFGWIEPGDHRNRTNHHNTPYNNHSSYSNNNSNSSSGSYRSSDRSSSSGGSDRRRDSSDVHRSDSRHRRSRDYRDDYHDDYYDDDYKDRKRRRRSRSRSRERSRHHSSSSSSRHRHSSTSRDSSHSNHDTSRDSHHSNHDMNGDGKEDHAKEQFEMKTPEPERKVEENSQNAQNSENSAPFIDTSSQQQQLQE